MAGGFRCQYTHFFSIRTQFIRNRVSNWPIWHWNDFFFTSGCNRSKIFIWGCFSIREPIILTSDKFPYCISFPLHSPYKISRSIAFNCLDKSSPSTLIPYHVLVSNIKAWLQVSIWCDRGECQLTCWSVRLSKYTAMSCKQI